MTLKALIAYLKIEFVGFFYKHQLRKKVKNKDFTIISNNCWAGQIYQDLEMEYLTPTVGLYFMAEDYVKFVKDIKQYITSEIHFVKVSKHKSINAEREKNNKNYPIGVVNDVEIHFLHYKSEQEAEGKWKKRCERINFDNLFVKMDDQNGFRIEHLQEFEKLPFKNKLFFSSKPLENYSTVVYLPYYKNNESVGDVYAEKWAFYSVFDPAKWLNGNS